MFGDTTFNLIATALVRYWDSDEWIYDRTDYLVAKELTVSEVLELGTAGLQKLAQVRCRYVDDDDFRVTFEDYELEPVGVAKERWNALVDMAPDPQADDGYLRAMRK